MDGVVAVKFFSSVLNTCKAVRAQLWCLVNSSPLYGITTTIASDLGVAANRESK